jgi:integrase
MADRRSKRDKAIAVHKQQGVRRALVRIPADELKELNQGLPEGIRLLSTGKYQARFRDGSKKEVARNFSTLGAARDWRANGLSSVAKGDWTNPQQGKRTVADFYPVYLANKGAKKASTRADTAYLWGQQVDVWGDHPVGSIKAAEVAEWVRALTAAGHSQSVVRRCVLLLAGILDVAVEHEALAKNPVDRSRLGNLYPSKSTHKANPLTLDQLDELIAHSSDHYRAMTEFIARTGLRMSEVRELRVKDLRLTGISPAKRNYSKHPVLKVDRAVVNVQSFDSDGNPVTRVRNGKTVNVYVDVIDTPKSGQQREVPLTPRAKEIAKSAAKGKQPEDLLFLSSTGGVVNRRGFATSLTDAVQRAGIETETGQPITPHCLRDTFATQALHSGASIIAVSRALGHADPSITLSRYAGLLPEDTDTLRAGLTAAEKAQTKKKSAKKGA